jgi:phosphotriesterase-related protein
MIRTVTGDIAAIEGPILAHEHLQLDLTAQKGPNTVLGREEEPQVVADIKTAMGHGLRAICDLSAPGWGRNLPALKRISESAGLPVVAAAGFYWDPFPDFAATASVEEMCDRIIRELEEGVEGTGLRCGVIKIGTDKGEPDDRAERLFRAAVAAAMATGFSIITHTSKLAQATWQVDVLERAGMDMKRVLISHMGAASDVGPLVAIGARGVYLGVDKVSFPIGPRNPELADLVCAALERDLGRQIILSSDVARRTMLSPAGAPSYSAVFVEFLPLLRERGVSEDQIRTMMVENPARLLSRAG